MKKTEFNDLVSMQEAIEITGISKLTLIVKMRKGLIAISKINNKIYFLRKDVLLMMN